MSSKIKSSENVSATIDSASTTVPAIVSAPPAVDAAAIQAFVAAIDAFALIVGAGFEIAQPEEVKRRPKARRDAPTIVPMVADLSTRYGVASKAYPTETTLANQQVVATLAPVAERIAAVQKLVSERMRSGQSGAWEGAMVAYALLKSEARGNGLLRSALTPVREKMRVTYVTEEGGKTKLRGRAAPKGRSGASVAAAAPGGAPESTVPATSAVATPAPVSSSPPVKATHT